MNQQEQQQLQELLSRQEVVWKQYAEKLPPEQRELFLKQQREAFMRQQQQEMIVKQQIERLPVELREQFLRQRQELQIRFQQEMQVRMQQQELAVRQQLEKVPADQQEAFKRQQQEIIARERQEFAVRFQQQMTLLLQQFVNQAAAQQAAQVSPQVPVAQPAAQVPSQQPQQVPVAQQQTPQVQATPSQPQAEQVASSSAAETKQQVQQQPQPQQEVKEAKEPQKSKSKEDVKKKQKEKTSQPALPAVVPPPASTADQQQQSKQSAAELKPPSRESRKQSTSELKKSQETNNKTAEAPAPAAVVPTQSVSQSVSKEKLLPQLPQKDDAITAAESKLKKEETRKRDNSVREKLKQLEQLEQLEEQQRDLEAAAKGTQSTKFAAFQLPQINKKRHTRMHTDPSALGTAAAAANFKSPPRTAASHHSGVPGVAVPVSELVKLRNAIVSREKELLELRQEVTTLKCIERRQQRDLDSYLADDERAPRLIKYLREEIHITKEKLKEATNLKVQEERKARQLSDRLIFAQERAERYRKLVEEADMEGREELMQTLKEAKQQIAAVEKTCIDYQRRYEMAQKNHVKEYERHLQKVKQLEQEIVQLKDQAEENETKLREKEKKIASLVIYKNQHVAAVNSGECKSCRKRRKEEELAKTRQEIIEKLAIPSKPQIINLSPSSVNVSVAVEELLDASQVEVEEIHLELTKLQSVDTNEPVLIKMQAAELLNEPLELTSLAVGQEYSIRACPVHRSIEGQWSEEQRFVADISPEMPPSPQATVLYHPPRIELQLEAPTTDNGGSQPVSFRIYHTCSDNFGESSLIATIPITQPTFTYLEPSADAVHAFQVAAVNRLGEGKRSMLTDACHVLATPPTPFRPRIGKLGKNAALGKVQLPKDLPANCPELEGYRILGLPMELAGDLTNSNNNELDNNPSAIQVEVDSVKELTVRIPDLDPSLTYVFKAALKNSAGYSKWSAWSHPICLKKLLMIPRAPRFDILSATAVRISLSELPPVSQNTRKLEDMTPPKGVVGFKVYLSTTRPDNSTAVDQMALVGQTTFPTGKKGKVGGAGRPLPIEKPSANSRTNTIKRPSGTPGSQQSRHGSSNNLSSNTNSQAVDSYAVTVDGLEYGESYYLAVSLTTNIGEDSEKSPVAWIPLAAAIELPPSPPQSRQQRGSNNFLDGQQTSVGGSRGRLNDSQTLKSGSTESIGQQRNSKTPPQLQPQRSSSNGGLNNSSGGANNTNSPTGSNATAAVAAPKATKSNTTTTNSNAAPKQQTVKRASGPSAAEDVKFDSTHRQQAARTIAMQKAADTAAKK